jgi:sporulation protein YlmC with PRC-barrel domain
MRKILLAVLAILAGAITATSRISQHTAQAFEVEKNANKLWSQRTDRTFVYDSEGKNVGRLYALVIDPKEAKIVAYSVNIGPVLIKLVTIDPKLATYIVNTEDSTTPSLQINMKRQEIWAFPTTRPK